MDNVISGASPRSFRKKTYSSSSRDGSSRSSSGSRSTSNRTFGRRGAPQTAVYRSESFTGPRPFLNGSSTGTSSSGSTSAYRSSGSSSDRSYGRSGGSSERSYSRPSSSSSYGRSSSSGSSSGGYSRSSSNFSGGSRSGSSYGSRSGSSYGSRSSSSGTPYSSPSYSSGRSYGSSARTSYVPSVRSNRPESSSSYGNTLSSSTGASETRSYAPSRSSGSSYSRSSGSSSGSSYGRSSGSSSGYSRSGGSGRSSSYSGGRGGRSSGGMRGGGGRGRRPSYNFDEKMFVKKAELPSEEILFTPTFNFGDLEISSVLKKNIVSKGFNAPTPIQDQGIKPIMDGRDFLGIADTGTGKTAAFLIPMIEKVIKNRDSKVLIITPTRELADQINQELFLLTRDLRIFSVQCIGGSNINNQIFNLRRGYNFVIGTPGRLKDLFERNVLNLSGFDTVVLDEVDRMLDMGFVNEIKNLISFLPKDRQSLCFSATVDRKVEDIINVLLKPDRIKVSVKTGETAKNVEQDIVRITNHDDKVPKLEELLNTAGFDKVLIFVNTKREVDHLDKHLYTKGFAVTSIHGERRQNERKRSIESFKAGNCKILVATDVAARGLDINNVTHVINYDIPMTYEDYIHRVGRTGRANKKGVALTFVESRSYR